MPKKFQGENSKAAQAKARKNGKVLEEKERREKEEEDAKWRDDDKQFARKQARKEESERKRLEALSKKKERELLSQEEDSQISLKKPAVKLTQAQIRLEKERRDAVARASAKSEMGLKTHLDAPLEENINQILGEEVQARNLDDAITALSLKDKADKHPEKRMAAAYEEFELERLPILKIENPTLRLSQIKQLLRKEWMKHPNNPVNKSFKAFNTK